MNILCGLDDGYTQHCAVMLTSLFINTPDANIAVYVMHQGLASQSLKRLARVCSRFGHSFEPLLVDHGSLSRVPILEHAKVTSYLRLLVGHFLPEDLDRVLYLDSDLIVRSDLTPFYTQALGDDWVAAVADSPGPGQNERLGMSTSVRYFNTGVLLMNLPVWRAEQIGEQALRFAVEHADVIKWADQCALNAVCNGRAMICSPRWNAGEWVYSGTTAEQLGVEPHELEQAKVDPVIAHYSGSNKPWYGATSHPFAHEYYQYLKRTPYFGARHLVRRLASKGRQMLGKVSFR